MNSKIKTIGVLCSGGDGPGMNAAIRAVVRCALSKKFEVRGFLRGYAGLLNEEIIELNHRSVSGIIGHGGTILKTARSQEFRTPEGKKKAVEILKKHGVDALVVLGGDGSYRGANEVFRQYGYPIIGLPGTIDNDIFGTDQTIGCHTAVHTALEAIDKIRDTAQSMERIFVIEVMGNKSGYIASQVALGSGAEEMIIPERTFDFEALYRDIKEGSKKGKLSFMIVVAEGAGKAEEISAKVTEMTGLESRYVVLGHVQRGGSPLAPDRILATRVGVAAVELLEKGIYGKAVGVLQDEIHIIDLKNAVQRDIKHIDEYSRLIRMLA